MTSHPVGPVESSRCPYCARGYENGEYNCTGGCIAEFSVRIIGFCGPAGAGKSFAAAHLARAWRFTRVRFAGPLKAMMAALGLTPDEIEGHLKERPCDLLCGQTPRHAMQTIGTEWGRDMIGKRLWGNAWGRSVDSVPGRLWVDVRSTPPRVFHDLKQITAEDVRFANEAAEVRARGGLVVRIDRPGHVATCGTAHASEQPDFEPDLVIVNTGDAAFLVALDNLVRSLRWA